MDLVLNFKSLLRFEKRYGQMANGSLCVTRTLQHELGQNWGIRATVLYDQPPEFQLHFRRSIRLNRYLCHPLGVRDCVTARIGADDQNETLFTTQVGTDILLKPNRPALVVSSTSWAPDEDFGILLEAAVMYDRRAAALLDENDSADEGVLWKEISGGKQYLYPRLFFIITGSADLGICLHTSSSTLDLPMKVVDMFGCGLPVCAVSYSCIDQLVKVEKNGLLFSSSSELADELLVSALYLTKTIDALKSLKNGALETVYSARWAAEWEEHAKPLISEVISRKTNLNFSHLVSKLAIPANCLCHICCLNIMVNYFSAKYTNHSASCRSLPEQMKVKVCTMDELPCYTEPDEFEYKDDCDNLDEYDKVSDSCETVPETYPNADNLHSIIHGACHEQSEQIEENGKIKPGESSNLGVDMISIAGKESLRGMRFIYAVEADEDPQPWLKEKLSTTDA
ncbi:hypothetical protein PVK06_039481 [Gossypium arboreum]|uniref:UDP-glycosyltransferase TURAN n=1 Tax=Gossypium arboreum TaxID=29729 RepID=A0ABR0N322_GOSAR|nr:hypothetical protein PVK06_039481 [Gossypium arboreum]